MKMRHLTAALLAAVALTVAWLPDVLAADMLVKASAMTLVASAYSWTGFYLGANAGGGWGRSSADVVFDPRPHTGVIDSAVGSASHAINGGLGGLQAGYNWQARAFVFGLEADIEITGQKGNSKSTGTVTTLQDCLAPCVPPPPLVTTGKLDYAQKLPWFGTMRGRLGVTPADGWLLYATGGLAFGEVTADANFALPAGNQCFGPCPPAPSGSAASSFSQTRAGWVVGAGVEAAFGGGWSGKLEYLHLDLGSVSNSFTSTIHPFDGTLTAHSLVSDEIVRVGVNYRFGGAVVAKN
jgi:outer membrane immunogenic protein